MKRSMGDILYVYAIGRAGHALPADVRAVEAGNLAAFYSPVDDVEYNQGVIDARSKDVEWLGAIGYRHQSVMSALMKGGTIIPLRAFTLFATEDRLRDHLESERPTFEKILGRLEGKQEWTMRVEFDADKWNDAIVRRVDSLRSLAAEAETAGAGKAFLLRKKLDDEKKRASREAEQQVVGEVEQAVMSKLACDTVAETRQQRSGAFPQINVLINRDEESKLQELRDQLESRFAGDGVTIALTGPWPPYTFASNG
jgi:hypothetical protein